MKRRPPNSKLTTQLFPYTTLVRSPIPNMVNHETNELFFDNLEIPAENLIGEEGKVFKYILDGLNAERTLISAECIGDGPWFIDKVPAYRSEEHTSELQSLMRISYAVFCLKKKTHIYSYIIDT